MSRLIDADAMMKHLENLLCGACDTPCKEGWCDVCDYAFLINEMKKEPTVDAEPVRHGHNTNHGVRWFRCSECGWGMNDIYMADESVVKDFDKFPYYCPYCGAKIDGSKGEAKERREDADE